MRTLAFLLALSLTGHEAQARSGAYLGLGEVLQPAAVRGVISDWEFGIYAGNSVGFGKTVFKDGWLASVGPVISVVPGNDLGIFGLVGWQAELFWGFFFRAEGEVVGTFAGHVKSVGILGLAWYLGE